MSPVCLHCLYTLRTSSARLDELCSRAEHSDPFGPIDHTAERIGMNPTRERERETLYKKVE